MENGWKNIEVTVIENGWEGEETKVKYFEVYIEEGKILRGTENGKTVYPYIQSGLNSWINASGISEDDFKERVKNGTVKMM